MPEGTRANPAGQPEIVVAMLTYLRTDELPEAVDAVLAAIADDGENATVLVVDNDPAGGAMPLASRWVSAPVRFVHEPVPGIAAARNRALDETVDADLLVFIDDDERPHPGWLGALVSTWRRFSATAVVGPVVSTFDPEPEPWIVLGGFFSRPRMPTGTEVEVAATNNLLLDRARVRSAGVRFDQEFGTIGGSDSLFTRQLHERGGRIVWCDEAVVTDVVPPDRATRRWVLRRWLRLGNSSSRVSLAMVDGKARRVRLRLVLTAAGLARIGGGGARVLAGVVGRSMRLRALGARNLARGLGMAGGAWGYVYAEYRRRT